MAQTASWVEPSGEDQAAGLHKYNRSNSPYEQYMDEQGIPIIRGIGVYDTREVELGDWNRLGARGAFLYLAGHEDIKGMFILGVPGRGATKADRHMYDEFYIVIEGRGTTEVWGESGKKHTFEWQEGSLFMIPMNANFRFVNAGSSTAVLVAANNAPPIFNIFQDPAFIFENPYQPKWRFDESEDYFKPKNDIEADQVRGRAAVRSNVFPDIMRCELPLDNQRAPGYRRIQPYFHGFIPDAGTGGFIAQYPQGRYSKAHYHASGAILVCLRGEGYTFNWPVDLGPRPWETGHGDRVKIQEYKQGGLVAAAPGGGNWFHQHFSCGSEPMRVINYWGGPHGRWGINDRDEEEKAGNLYGIHEGGRTILYWQEDPYIREYYAEQLGKNGVQCDMKDSLYVKPDGVEWP